MKKITTLLFLLGVVNFICIDTIAQYHGSVITDPKELDIIKGTPYDNISLNDFLFNNEVGSPKVPVKILNYLLPLNVKVEGIKIRNTKRLVLDGEFNIEPCQPDFPVGMINSHTNISNNDKINSNSKDDEILVAEIVLDEITRGYHIVQVKFYPVSYNSEGKTLTLLTEINFTIEYSQSDKTFTQPKKISKRRNDLVKSQIRSMIENKDDLEKFKGGAKEFVNDDYNLNVHKKEDENSTSNQTNGPLKSAALNSISTKVEDQFIPDYIIITSEELKDAFKSLADWKIQKGVPAIIKTKEEIEENYPGTDIQEKIRNYLIEQYVNFGGLFVLIGGDIDVVPARLVDGVSTTPQLKDLPTDLYYATVDGDWNANGDGTWADGYSYAYEHYVGRAPASTIEDAEVVVTKMIGYEKLISGNTDYVENLCTYAAFLVRDNNDFYVDHFKYFKQFALSHVPSNCNMKYLFDHHDCNTTDGYNYHYDGGTCVEGDYELNKVNFINSLNGTLGSGKPHIIFHIDHSGVTGLGTSGLMKNESFRNTDISSLTSSGQYQIMWGSGCESAIFTKESIGEKFVTSENTDIAAYIGNADYGWSGEYTYYDAFYYTIYNGGYNPVLGACFQAITSWTTSVYYPKNRQRLTLFGDPEANIWTKSPSQLGVAVTPGTLVNGNNTIVVSVNNLQSGDAAQICIWKETEIYITEPVTSNGNYTFNISPEKEGSVWVTVTGQNYIPYQESLTVNLSQDRNLYIEDATVVDDNSGQTIGDGDTKIAAGETVEIYPKIKNNGLLTTSNVSVVVSSSNTNVVTIKPGYSTISVGDIASGELKEAVSPFVIDIASDAEQILENAPSADQVKLILTITEGSGASYNDEIYLEIYAPDIEQRNKIVVNTTDGDLEIEANETINFQVELFNGDLVSSGDLTASITALSSNIESITNNTVSYNSIGSLDQNVGEQSFQFNLSNNYVTDDAIMFSIHIENSLGREWNYVFDLNGKPDQFDIDLLWTDPSETSIIIGCDDIDSPEFKYNVYRCDVDDDDNLVGEFQVVNDFLLEHAYFEDVNLEELTRYAYKIGVVNDEGNESILSDYIITGTSYPVKMNFPVEMNINLGAIYGSPICVDVNKDLKMEIFTATEAKDVDAIIVGLNYDGEEMFDIDGNLTTKSGLATIDAKVEAGLAIGDVDSDNNLDVVVATRGGNENSAVAYKTIDENGGYEPNKVYQYFTDHIYYRAPVLCNVDNSPDGSIETILCSESNTSGISIIDNEGNLMCTFGTGLGWSIGVAAVSDLDNDGDMEIIRGGTNGVYIWHHDGTNFGSQQPVFTITDKAFYTPPIVCDLENDGVKDILVLGINDKNHPPYIGKVYVINSSGNLKTGWESGAGSFEVDEYWHAPGIAVGNLDGAGALEIVTSGKEKMLILNADGTVLQDIYLRRFYPYKSTPVIGDIDGDDDLEVVITDRANGDLLGYNYDGKPAKGFPLKMDIGSYGSACLTDLEHNGKTDIVAVSENKIYAWETSGNANSIAWGSSRANNWNTGSLDEEFLLPESPDVQIVDEFVDFEDAEGGITIYGSLYEEGEIESYYDFEVNQNEVYGISDLPVIKGERIKLTTSAINEFGHTESENEIWLYNSVCDESNSFSTNDDFIDGVDIQKFESSDVIVAGGNVVIPLNSNAIFSAKNTITLEPGFFAPVGAFFYAYIEGCDVTELKRASIQSKDGEDVEEEMDNAAAIYIYPNPNRGRFTISSNCSDCEYTALVYNMNGQLIYHKTFKNEQEINMSEEAKGIYILIVRSPESVVQYKIIIN